MKASIVLQVKAHILDVCLTNKGIPYICAQFVEALLGLKLELKEWYKLTVSDKELPNSHRAELTYLNIDDLYAKVEELTL